MVDSPTNMKEERPPTPRPRKSTGQRALLIVGALVLALGFGSAAFWACFAIDRRIGLFCAVAVFVALMFWTLKSQRLRPAFELLVLVVLPLWGLALNHSFNQTCVQDACGADEFRYLVEPDVFGLLFLHVVTALAYLGSRRRPEALYAPAELFVHVALVSGIVFQALVAVQFSDALLLGLILPLGMPAFTPILTIALYAHELRARLRRRGAEPVPLLLPAEGIYRAPSGAIPAHAPPGLAARLLVRAVAVSPVLLGAYAVIAASFTNQWSGAVRVFTGTCGHALSRLPITQAPGDCHYLCTVAAQGHPRLVRPYRFGRRRGETILVNRQLAVANAFEDLLHARWPRFGAFARRTYDRLGWPVSRWIRHRLVADAVYLAMKPAEWLFYAALVLLDPGAPEERIERMYR